MACAANVKERFYGLDLVREKEVIRIGCARTQMRWSDKEQTRLHAMNRSDLWSFFPFENLDHFVFRQRVHHPFALARPKVEQ